MHHGLQDGPFRRRHAGKQGAVLLELRRVKAAMVESALVVPFHPQFCGYARDAAGGDHHAVGARRHEIRLLPQDQRAAAGPAGLVFLLGAAQATARALHSVAGRRRAKAWPTSISIERRATATARCRFAGIMLVQNLPAIWSREEHWHRVTNSDSLPLLARTSCPNPPNSPMPRHSFDSPRLANFFSSFSVFAARRRFIVCSWRISCRSSGTRSCSVSTRWSIRASRALISSMCPSSLSMASLMAFRSFW